MTTYGPHRPEDHLNQTVVIGHDRWNPERTEPIHRDLIRQREVLNVLAEGQTRPQFVEESR